MGCRKSVSRLTATERQKFVDAVLQLKANGEYDKYADMHLFVGGRGHGGPAFFPWHREFILRFERDLQAIDADVTLPYWDWTVDNLNGAGTESMIWRDDFMGGPGNASRNVTTGPFASWGLRRNQFDPFTNVGNGGQINSLINNSTTYTQFRAVEGPHGSAHVWVGGTLGSVATAPADPTFFLLHCNVDRLWSEWIDQHQGDPGFVAYEPPTGNQGINQDMWPWNGSSPNPTPPWDTSPEIIRPADLLIHRDLGYFYDTIDPECQPKRFPKIEKVENKELRKEKEIEKLALPLENNKRLLKERIKELKESRKEIKELKEGGPKEGKELKEGPKEIKELKEGGPKEGKELKEGGKDFKEQKELDKENKEFKEKDKDLVERGHFIPRDLRPDLARGALNLEPGDEETRLLSEELQANAENAKTQKDNKDIEKLREG